MFGIRDVDCRALRLGADIDDFQQALFQWNVEDKGRQQGDPQSGHGGIAHEQAIVDIHGGAGVHGHVFPPRTKAPIRGPTIAVNDASMVLEILHRSGSAMTLEIFG